MAHHFKESKQQIHIMKIKYFLNHCHLLKIHSSFFKRMHQSKVLTFPPDIKFEETLPGPWMDQEHDLFFSTQLTTSPAKKMPHHKWMFNMSIFTIICCWYLFTKKKSRELHGNCPAVSTLVFYKCSVLYNFMALKADVSCSKPCLWPCPADLEIAAFVDDSHVGGNFLGISNDMKHMGKVYVRRQNDIQT